MRSPAAKKAILVVDDEPDVRKLVGAMVTHYGYKVLTADSCDHAIAIFKKNQAMTIPTW
jgi:CheY-like chemotaxis protein